MILLKSNKYFRCKKRVFYLLYEKMLRKVRYFLKLMCSVIQISPVDTRNEVQRELFLTILLYFVIVLLSIAVARAEWFVFKKQKTKNIKFIKKYFILKYYHRQFVN